ncbi:hypothetical protein FRC00_010949, partial [Tulasnella sp. 408]
MIISSDVMTGEIPYVQVLSDPKVIMAIIGGNVPVAEEYPELPAADPLWEILRECWKRDPANRPTMAHVLEKEKSPARQAISSDHNPPRTREGEAVMEEAQAGPVSSSSIQSQQDRSPHITTNSSPEGHSGDSEELALRTLDLNDNPTSRDTTLNLTSPLHNDKVKQAASFIPYALKWSEHEMELKPVKALSSSKPSGMTSIVFPRLEHSCTEIPNSDGEFIIFGGKVKPDKEEVWTNDVILLSTIDMSLTSLETNGAKPKKKSGHRAVIVGRVL